ncbi:MAG: outer membrane protein assembly factor [Methylobacter sp.]|nr:MAG: outer membrane protein assembly factor [Methylobacter sp.]
MRRSPVLNRNIFLALTLLLVTEVEETRADIEITGVDGLPKDNVLLTLSLNKETCASPEWKIKQFFAQADSEIDQALRAVGYYRAHWEKSLTFNPDCWRAAFNIAPGRQTVIEAVNINISGEALDDPDFQKLTAKLKAEAGNPLQHNHYEKMKRRIEALADEKGYLDGSFTRHELRVDKDRNSAVVTLDYHSGKRLQFGTITIEQDKLDPEFVRKYLPITTGDYYSGPQLAKTYTALSNSGYFKTVAIDPDVDASHNGKVPVNIILKSKPKYHYSTGLGFDTDIGPLLSGNFINRRINTRGHYLTANLDLSPVQSTADVEYNIPLDNPATDSFSVGAGLKREDTDSYRSFLAKLSGRLKHAYPNGWKQTLALDYSYEDYTTGGTSEQTVLLVPNASWLRSVSDNLLRPTRGYRVQADVGGSHKSLISSVSFLQGLVSATWLQPGFGSGTLITRADLGATLVDPFNKLPTTYRFYAGGINSVRGYAYRELGPIDATGEVVGGQYLSTFSLEYEQPVLPDWSAALFVDTGNAFNSTDIQLKTGVGLGVRWFSPIGPVRLDFAIPLDESKSSFQIHFATGSRL